MSTKYDHEVRDAVHGFVRFSDYERAVIDSPALQRLKSVHQLAMTYQVYPGAVHRRFEHTLGVMDVATRIFDQVVAAERRYRLDQASFPEIHGAAGTVEIWRNTLRIAALCHDIGHLPFSHAAEDRLLPDKTTHETISRLLIERSGLRGLIEELDPAPKIEDVVYVALGEKVMGMPPRNSWIALLSQILTADGFGADRIDYLLRDAHHAGVASGRFDHLRLINTFRILPVSQDGEQTGDSSLSPFRLGIEEGGLLAVESLLMARYFMFQQVYFHHVRKAYDHHLTDFLEKSLAGALVGLVDSWQSDQGGASEADDFLGITDDEILAQMRKAAVDGSHPGHEPARRIMARQHLRLLYEPEESDLREGSANPGKVIADALRAQFRGVPILHERYSKASGAEQFRVLRRSDGKVVRAVTLSNALQNVPQTGFDHVLCAPEKIKEVRRWLDANKVGILDAGAEATYAES